MCSSFSVLCRSRLRRPKQENYTLLRASGSFSSDSTYGSSPTDSCDFGLSSQIGRDHPPEFFVGQSSPAGLSPGVAPEDIRSKGYDFSRQVIEGHACAACTAKYTIFIFATFLAWCKIHLKYEIVYTPNWLPSSSGAVLIAADSTQVCDNH